ncbi:MULTISPECIES: hypothetical protein [unclassified Moritella]|uniref:hypothetical protein n=1 Tax=unclassified Moritella TaxID=2637987 RepID=UPI001BA7E29C|nr:MULTISPECIES: hypothetical protein [unclassified Moritella]QUM84938.1 hypothetical protein HWV02_10750 [Moritella sp. 28]QUM89170.1 hypothetical protein HWV03_10355 [Moritella sp. 36]
MFGFVSRLKRFKKSVISKKTPVLILLNKQLPKNAGCVVDFSINKKSRCIVIELVRDEQLNKINVINYGVHFSGTDTIISWSKIKVDGTGTRELKRVLAKQKSIILPAYLFNLVDRVMNTQDVVSAT